MRNSLWASIDPDTEWRTAPEGGYTDLAGETVPTATQRVGSSLRFGPLNVDHPHFGFGIVLLATGALIYSIYEGKPVRGAVKASLGPADAEIEAGV